MHVSAERSADQAHVRSANMCVCGVSWLPLGTSTAYKPTIIDRR